MSDRIFCDVVFYLDTIGYKVNLSTLALDNCRDRDRDAESKINTTSPDDLRSYQMIHHRMSLYAINICLGSLVLIYLNICNFSFSFLAADDNWQFKQIPADR